MPFPAQPCLGAQGLRLLPFLNVESKYVKHFRGPTNSDSLWERAL